MTDITFKTKDGLFLYKAIAIIVHEDKVLMTTHDKIDYYYPIGGRVKINETSHQSVLREAKEETGLDFEIDRLAYIREVIWDDEETKQTIHEVAFCYYMKPHANICDALMTILHLQAISIQII